MMEIMERDPQHIAKVVRDFRKMRRLTQENLADAANLSTRTIEKIESGKHTPDEQSLRSLARALGIGLDAFRKPTPEEEARFEQMMRRAVRKTVVVPTKPIRTANDFLEAFDQRHASRMDMSSVQDDQALDIAASLSDSLQDLNDIWRDCYMSQRLSYARGFADQCQEMERFGYLCHMGSHKQRLREKGKPDLIFDVNVMVILPKVQDGTRYAMIELEGAWETLESDRIGLPPEKGADSC
jgi:transcriptional regulator with XRE-family HTH domain